MKPEEHLTTPRLQAPRAAAIAGILFAILLITSIRTPPAVRSRPIRWRPGHGFRPVRTPWRWR